MELNLTYTVTFKTVDDRNAAAKACYQQARAWQRHAAKVQRRRAMRDSERAMILVECDRMAAIFYKLGNDLGGERPIYPDTATTRKS
jgi:hypothetical protein